MIDEELKYKELKYMIALQPLLKERMGPWQFPDLIYSITDEEGGVVIDVINDAGNWVRCMWSKGRSSMIHDDVMKQGNYLRLPLPIDPRNPGRGLWGMLDWDKIIIAHMAEGIETLIKTPYLALLKALCHQEGITV